MRGPAQVDVPWCSIAYLGPPGTFTEEALFSDPQLRLAEAVSCSSVDAAVEACAGGTVEAAFVPVENSIEGTVGVTLDALVSHAGLYVQAERYLDVHLQLLGHPGSTGDDVTEVLSFGHALGQCKGYLADHLPGAKLTEVSSTAEAARWVAASGSRHLAAVAGTRAAEIYGLCVLASGIEDRAGSRTRFVLVSGLAMPAPSGRDVTSIACRSRDSAGYFVADVVGHVSDPDVSRLVEAFSSSVGEARFLGSYPASRAEVTPRVWA